MEQHLKMKRIAGRIAPVLLPFVLLAVLVGVAMPPDKAQASWETRGVVSGRSLGYWKGTPTTEKTFNSTPTAGVTIPAGTKTVVLCVETNQIRYFNGGSTAATGTLGLLLAVGCYTLTNDNGIATEFRFIDSSAGASTVTAEFLGER